jgi:HEPN domain-containing protein
MAEIDKARLVKLAEAKVEDAKLLLSVGRAANAYYLAGYAVELMLKAILSGRFRENTLPDRALVSQLYSHDLARLTRLALLDVALQQHEESDGDFRSRWEIVLRWTEESRYGEHDGDATAALIEAIENPEHGVLPWLRNKL